MDGSAPAEPVVGLSGQALAQLMPLHILLSADGMITGVGPTLAKLLASADVRGTGFFELFRVRRPAGIQTMEGILARLGQRMDLVLRDGPATGLRGLAVAQAGGGVLINLSFGIGVIEAVGRHKLTDADFPPTDLTVEMLYVVEAKSAVMEELRDLNLRLQGAKQVAEELALTDALTRLRNRRALEAVIDLLIRGGAPFTLMHLDLDFFKQVNDSYGHAAGDHVLVKVAEALVAETRRGDTVARVGGDEFVIVLPRLDDPRGIMQIAQRMIHRLGEPIPFDGHLCHVSASIGIVVSSDYPTADANQMLADADRALYASKHAGRGVANRFVPSEIGSSPGNE